MDHIGIDVHKKESQICILVEGGELIERRIGTEPRRFGEVLGGRAPAQVLLESSTESEWVARCLEALGHHVVVADPNFAPMYATRTRKVKTDRRDARALAAKQATRTIPIVFIGAGDPVTSGLVTSLGRPGGNITGLTSQVDPEIVGKCLELLKQAVPKVKRVGTINP